MSVIHTRRRPQWYHARLISVGAKSERVPSALSFKSSSLTSVFWLMLRPMPRPFILTYLPLLHSMKSALFAWVIYQRTYSVTAMLKNFLPDRSFGRFHAHGWTHFQITRKSFRCYFDISELRGIVYSAWVKSGLIVPQILCIAVQCIASRLIAVHKYLRW